MQQPEISIHPLIGRLPCILGICDFLGISIYFDENMLSHSAAGKNVCIESVDENDKI